MHGQAVSASATAAVQDIEVFRTLSALCASLVFYSTEERADVKSRLGPFQALARSLSGLNAKALI
jgi:hypothetical protein